MNNIMAKIRTKKPILWGGFDVTIPNNIEVEMKELNKNADGCLFQISDYVMFPHTYTDEEGLTSNYEVATYKVREKQRHISNEEYNQLYAGVEQYLNAYFPDITELEKSLKRNSIGLYLFFLSDVLSNGKLGYNTLAQDWEIVW